MKQVKIIVEKHVDGYIAYPLGLKGIVVAEGDTCEQALTEIKSAIQFHLDAFGKDALSDHSTLKSSTLRTICTQANIPRS